MMCYEALCRHLMARLDQVPVNKEQFLTSLLQPVVHWALPIQTHKAFLDPVKNPMQLVGVLKWRGEVRYAIRLIELVESPLRADLQRFW